MLQWRHTGKRHLRAMGLQCPSHLHQRLAPGTQRAEMGSVVDAKDQHHQIHGRGQALRQQPLLRLGHGNAVLATGLPGHGTLLLLNQSLRQLAGQVGREAGARQPELPAKATDAHLARFDKFRNASGGTSTVTGRSPRSESSLSSHAGRRWMRGSARLTALAMTVAAASACAAVAASTVTASAMPSDQLRPRQPDVAMPRTGSAARIVMRSGIPARAAMAQVRLCPGAR